MLNVSMFLFLFHIEVRLIEGREARSVWDHPWQCLGASPSSLLCWEEGCHF